MTSGYLPAGTWRTSEVPAAEQRGEGAKDRSSRARQSRGCDLPLVMAAKGGISVTQAKRLSGEIGAILRDAVAAGEHVRLPALGKMRTTLLRGEAWDPKRREMVPRETRVIRFKGEKLEADEQK